MEVRYSNIVQILPVKNRADLTVNRALNSAAEKTSYNKTPVNFQGVQTILKGTKNNIDEIYALYKTSLKEVPLTDIIDSVNTLAENTGHRRKDVLFAMQQLTNFSNMRSIREIADVLERDHISEIFNNKKHLEHGNFSECAIDIMKGNSGFHKTLEYLIHSKGFGDLNKFHDNKTAFFLDKKNIESLERLKKECPDDFLKIKNNKNIKFYYLSGWDNGITFINRNRSLETETRKLINTSDETGLPLDIAADAPFLKQIHRLGISPTVISQDGLPTEICIYNRLAPEKMTKSELTNIIIANAEIRSVKASQELKTQEESAEYLSRHLKVFTPEYLAILSSELNKNLSYFAREKGVAQKDIVYIEPDLAKSNSLINYMYKNVNNIPDEQFITFAELNKKGEHFLDNKMLVILDDCTITGNSIKDMIFMDMEKIKDEVPKVFVCYGATANAKRTIKSKKNTEKNIHLIIGDYIPHSLTNKMHMSDRRIERVVGKPNYVRGEATCLVFPYMSPDTNTELASNIALLHNTNYRLSNIMVPYPKHGFVCCQAERPEVNPRNLYVHKGIKNYTLRTDRIAKRANELIGSTPVTIESNPYKNEESFADKLYRLICCKR